MTRLFIAVLCALTVLPHHAAAGAVAGAVHHAPGHVHGAGAGCVDCVDHDAAAGDLLGACAALAAALLMLPGLRSRLRPLFILAAVRSVGRDRWPIARDRSLGPPARPPSPALLCVLLR